MNGAPTSTSVGIAGGRQTPHIQSVNFARPRVNPAGSLASYCGEDYVVGICDVDCRLAAWHKASRASSATHIDAIQVRAFDASIGISDMQARYEGFHLEGNQPIDAC
jgi:hypothetical protein